jgi:hypothetical protein
MYSNQITKSFIRVQKKKKEVIIKRFYFKKSKVHKSFSSILSGIFRTSVNSSVYGASTAGSGVLSVFSFFLQTAKKGWIGASPVAASLITSSTNVILLGVF